MNIHSVLGDLLQFRAEATHIKPPIFSGDFLAAGKARQAAITAFRKSRCTRSDLLAELAYLERSVQKDQRLFLLPNAAVFHVCLERLYADRFLAEAQRSILEIWSKDIGGFRPLRKEEPRPVPVFGLFLTADGCLHPCLVVTQKMGKAPLDEVVHNHPLAPWIRWGPETLRAYFAAGLMPFMTTHGQPIHPAPGLR